MPKSFKHTDLQQCHTKPSNHASSCPLSSPIHLLFLDCQADPPPANRRFSGITPHPFAIVGQALRLPIVDSE